VFILSSIAYSIPNNSSKKLSFKVSTFSIQILSVFFNSSMSDCPQITFYRNISVLANKQNLTININYNFSFLIKYVSLCSKIRALCAFTSRSFYCFVWLFQLFFSRFFVFVHVLFYDFSFTFFFFFFISIFSHFFVVLVFLYYRFLT
jgi:hypothetical protein